MSMYIEFLPYSFPVEIIRLEIYPHPKIKNHINDLSDLMIFSCFLIVLHVMNLLKNIIY